MLHAMLNKCNKKKKLIHSMATPCEGVNKLNHSLLEKLIPINLLHLTLFDRQPLPCPDGAKPCHHLALPYPCHLALLLPSPGGLLICPPFLEHPPLQRALHRYCLWIGGVLPSFTLPKSPSLFQNPLRSSKIPFALPKSPSLFQNPLRSVCACVCHVSLHVLSSF